jgi:hypothetical protein
LKFEKKNLLRKGKSTQKTTPEEGQLTLQGSGSGVGVLVAMALKVKRELVMSVSPEKAWVAVQDFQNVNWLAGVKAQVGSSGSLRRSIRLNDHEVEEELVVKSSAQNKVLEWSIVNTTLPVSNWVGRLSVTSVGLSRSRVTFECSFDSPDKQMKVLFTNLYDEGLARIKLGFEG